MAAPVLARLRNRLLRRELPIWYSPSYKLPLSGLESTAGLEPRRADLVAWWLLDANLVAPNALRAPHRVSYEDLDRVHGLELLESLGRPEKLAAIFGVDADELPVDEVMTTVRLACGGTLEAARTALARRGPALNLLGGFHHAGPSFAGGFCPLNDVAVALATVRSEGFAGQAVVLDVDAHPPDGIAACLAADPSCWIGSLSGSDWGALEGVDESVLPPGTGDAPYLEALDALLRRMPRPELAFVLAGGDVLAGDRFGKLGLTVEGARRRDVAIARALSGVASVWLPAGGYSSSAWRVLAGSAMVLLGAPRGRIPERYDPLHRRFAGIASGFAPGELGKSPFDAADLEEALGLGRRRERLLLGSYSASGLEHALYRFGVLDTIRRLGFTAPRVVIDRTSPGDRARILGTWDGAEHLLAEAVLERRRLGGRDVLYVHWLSLRNPRARFSDLRPRLPGQDVPGLGIAREVGELLGLMARRLGLAGVAWRPTYLHTAYSARHNFQFLDPARQGRFEALVRDVKRLPLLEATAAVAEGRVWLDGAPYAWEAAEMALWLEPEADPARDAAIAQERERCRFEVR